MIRTNLPHTICLAGLAWLWCAPPQAFAQTAQCLSAAGTPAQRQVACSAILADPTLPDASRALALSARANAYLAENNIASALKDAEQSAFLTPNDVATLLLVSRLRQLNGDINQAIEASTAALARDASRSDAYTLRASQYFAIGNESAAIADLGEVRRLNPNDPAPFRVRGEYYAGQSKFDLAIDELRQAISVDTADVETRLVLARTLLRAGQSQEAVNAATDILTRQPNSTDARRMRATAYGQIQNYRAAIDDLNAVLAVNSNDAAAVEARSVAALQSGQWDLAIADLTSLLRAQPQRADWRYFRGLALLQRGQADSAVADFSETLRQLPGDADARAARATAYAALRKFDVAIDDLTVALRSAPSSALFLAQRAQTFFMAGQYPQAAADFAAAQQAGSNNPDHALWQFLARSYAKQDGRAELTAKANTLRRDQWPAPVFAFFLGEKDGTDVLIDASAASNHVCQARFYLGHGARLLGNRALADEQFTAARSVCAPGSFEHLSALLH